MLQNAADTPEGCAAIRGDLGRLEKWAERSLVKLNKRNCKVLPLGGITPGRGGKHLGKQLGREGRWGSGGHKRKMRQQRTLTAKTTNSILDYIRKSIASRSTRWSFLSTHLLWDTSGVQGPVLSSPVQERQGCNGKSPAKGRKDDEGIRAPFTWGKVMRIGMVQHGKEKAREDLVNMHRVLTGANDGAHQQDKWQCIQIKTQEIPSEHKKTCFLLWGWSNTRKGFPERLWRQPTPGNRTWAGVLD